MKKLSQSLVKLLTKKRLKISFAESCTGGLLSSSITSISGSSKVFTLGLVTYSNQSKINTLKVPKKTIMKHGAVSYETCLSMVKNLNRISKTNLNVKILYVIREQNTWLYSAWKQVIVDGSNVSLDRFINSPSAHPDLVIPSLFRLEYLNYSREIKELYKLFGAENVCVVPDPGQKILIVLMLPFFPRPII